MILAYNKRAQLLNVAKIPLNKTILFVKCQDLVPLKNCQKGGLYNVTLILRRAPAVVLTTCNLK